MYLLESVSNHVSHSPALVLYETPQGCEQDAVAGLLLLRNNFGDGNQDLDGEQPDAVLVVLGQMLEHGYHLFNNNRGRHLLHKPGEVGRSLSAHHRGLIVDELAELLAELLLDRRRDFLVRGGVESTSRYLRGEPVGLR